MVSLVGLWGFAANITLGAALDKYDFTTTYEKMVLPGLQMVNEIQQERAMSVVAMSTRNAQDKQKLGVERARVSAIQGAFRKAALSSDATDAATPETKQRLAEATKALDRLPALRNQVDSGRVETLDVIDSYSTVLDSVIQVFNDLVIVNDLDIFKQGRALINMGNSRAFMLREDALVSSALAKNGKLSATEHLAFVQWAANGRLEFEAGFADLKPALRAPLERLANSDAYKRYRAMESAIVNSRGSQLPPEAANWTATTSLVSQGWGQTVMQATLALNDLAKPIGQRVVNRLILAGGLGLLAVVASIILSVLAGRSLSRELRNLQRAALQLAEDRLPGVVARLRRGEEVDVEAEAPPLPTGKTKEVARVGDAFTKVQHTAIETAVRESYLRQGISRVFLNVAWRSQSLLHRQLRMLDEMERRASDPEVLEDLFRLDHLTTRMRRHAEGLVILSGTSPGRGWNRPVPVEDVIRAAVAEVEDYTRVEVIVVTEGAALIGETVADVVHLLAELIENATVFSPAPTEVLVRGEMGANGFAVDIVDRGIGLDQAELDALNLRLSQPPEFDLAVTDRLGLFVVARLAGRHGIRVALQPSVYGGVSAVVLIPRELIVDLDQADDDVVSGVPTVRRQPANAMPKNVRPITKEIHPISADSHGNGNGNGTGNGNGNGNGNGSGDGKTWTPQSRSMLNAPTPYDTGPGPSPTGNGNGNGHPNGHFNGAQTSGDTQALHDPQALRDVRAIRDPQTPSGPQTRMGPQPPNGTQDVHDPQIGDVGGVNAGDTPVAGTAMPGSTPGGEQTAPSEWEPGPGGTSAPDPAADSGPTYHAAPTYQDAPAFDEDTPTFYSVPTSYNAPSTHDTSHFDTSHGHEPPGSFNGPYKAPETYRAPTTEPMPWETPTSFGDQGDGPGGSRAPLPRRVKRASLAPQLRNEEPVNPYGQYDPDDTLVAWEERSAEASRDLFAALQAGWLRGRDEDEGPADHPEGRGPS
ncbi:nitrate- and nitrite sensing domain-containing protein [Actinomadura barringtoniae]|uniref:histidine kinase n=1 Tax=Actinomadura barringtoniae TaxID=1427535 RepID=A0A939T0M1_9ACTN|nr:nitrate- and nitrite sensing domain-containing protein [Actinomadura barringtoniae]MBO2445611.1 nitrate- and nitrite sensing domain-containing protein [Actinomadura barringtoniae]